MISLIFPKKVLNAVEIWAISSLPLTGNRRVKSPSPLEIFCSTCCKPESGLKNRLSNAISTHAHIKKIATMAINWVKTISSTAPLTSVIGTPISKAPYSSPLPAPATV